MLGTVLQTANCLLPLYGHQDLGQVLPILAADTTTTSGGDITDEHGLGYKSDNPFNLNKFFDNFAQNGLKWAYAIIGLLGVAAIVFAAYNIVTGLMSHGRKQTSWPMNIVLLLLGGVMAFGGWNLFAGTIAAGGAATVENWATR